MRLLILILLSACAGTVSAAGADGNAGTCSAEFLNVGGGARSLAMGGTGVAGLEEPAAIWLNPAGIARQKEGGGSFMHGAYLEGMAMEQLALAVPTPIGSVGGAISALRVGETDVFNNAGTREGTFSPLEVAITGAYARVIRMAVLGAAVSYLHSQLAEGVKTSGVSVDIGASANPVPDLSVGASVQHLGSSLEYVGESAAIPLTIRGGISYRMKTAGLILASDVVKPSDEALSLRIGLEENMEAGRNMVLSARGGWRSGTAAGSLSGLTAGGAVCWYPKEDFLRRPEGSDDSVWPSRYRLSGISVEYAWTPLGDLGQAHWFSFALIF